MNRTFRGKPDGLLVGYAPLADNLQKALSEYTTEDQAKKPVGKNIDEAVAVAKDLVATLGGLVDGYDWRAVLKDDARKAWPRAVNGTVNYLRSPSTPGNHVDGDDETLAERYRRLSSQLARAWALCSRSEALEPLRPEARFHEDVRVTMAKFDAADRQARGEPVPEAIQRLLAELIATSTETGDVLDIYSAAGMPKPSLSDLTPQFIADTQKAPNPQLAIEALRKLVAEESGRVARNNIVRQRAFSERVTELMTKYTNQQLTSAEVIAELVALAQEVAAESDRGKAFTPALNDDELAFYDAVAQNESAVEVQGEGVLAQIARDLVGVMRRDVRTDWTVRDDVRAKLRSSIKRLLVIHGYPPDRQPAAIKLVMEQMESMAPRFADGRQ